MADYTVSTAQELMNAITDALDSNTSVSIQLTADIDFNNSPYYNWNSNFLNIYSSASINGKIITIDGDNHKLTNIYCKSNNNILYLGINGGTINIKNLTIEAITTDGTIASFLYRTNFENVTFNIKAYNVNRYLFNITSPVWKITFTNCIFNLYLTNTANTFMSLFYCENKSSSSYYSVFNEFYSCIFKLRNATDKAMYIFNMTTALSRDACYLENCAIFYNDVGSKTLDYESYAHRISSRNFPTLINTYIASFGTIDEKPKLMIHNEETYPTHTVQSCFVDSDKIQPIISNNIITPSSGTVGGVTALTTTQCKDKNKLSEIGYIFAEET